MTTTEQINKVVLIGVMRSSQLLRECPDTNNQQATGNLGKIVLSALINAKAFQVTILTRGGSSASSPPDVAVIKTDYSEPSLVKAFAGQDAVISAVGATGFMDQKAFIDAAVKAGIKRFIPSEFSSNTLSDAVRQLVPVFEAKKVVLDYLKEKEATGLTWTGLSPGLLLDWVGFEPSHSQLKRPPLTEFRGFVPAFLVLTLLTGKRRSGMTARPRSL